jgi:hypothetical protein
MFKRLIPVILMSLLGSNTALAGTTFDVGKHGPLASLSVATGHHHKPRPPPHPRPRPMPAPPTKTQVIVGGIVTGVVVVAVVAIVLSSNHAHDNDPHQPKADEETGPQNKPQKNE